MSVRQRKEIQEVLWQLNFLYGLLLLILSPAVLWRMVRHGRYRRGWPEKLLGNCRIQADGRPVVWFHAVSVGEVIQLQKIVAEFRRQSQEAFQIVVSTSTDTGFDLARQRLPSELVIWFPLDFSWAVRRALRQIQPRAVILMELEIWPNFLQECHRRNVATAIINARMSDRSVRGYRRLRWFLKPVLSQLTLVAAQSRTYADRLIELGVQPDRVHVTGSIKFDGVSTDRSGSGTLSLRRLFGIGDSDVVFIAGSTQAPEEQLALDAWSQLRPDWPALRLILVPRHRERFEEVAGLVQGRGLPLVRRSQATQPTESGVSAETAAAERPILLLDTIGELSACWGLADLAFVGGSFGARGGQNMIEPAAYGAAIMFGPNTSNFRDVVALFQSADACLQLNAPGELVTAVRRLLQDSDERERLGLRARSVVLAQQGATAATASLLTHLPGISPA